MEVKGTEPRFFTWAGWNVIGMLMCFFIAFLIILNVVESQSKARDERYEVAIRTMNNHSAEVVGHELFIRGSKIYVSDFEYQGRRYRSFTGERPDVFSVVEIVDTNLVR